MAFRRFFGEEPERRKWQDPEKILRAIGLRPGFTFIDVGCGYGFFTIPAAKLVGPEGKAYGIDIDEDAIERTKQRVSQEALENVTLKVGEAEKTILCTACADMVFFSLVLHDFNDPKEVLGNARKMIKPAGKLIDLDWKKKPMEIGPPERIRFSERYASELIREARFVIDEVRPSGLYHYLIVAEPIENAEPYL